MKAEITLNEAKIIIEKYPSEDEYILAHLSRFMNHGEADDNSIELADYWQKCYGFLNKDKDKRKVQCQCVDCKKWVNPDEIAGDLKVCRKCYDKALEDW